MFKRSCALALTAVLALGITACETLPTPYQPQSSNKAALGFSETRLEADRYRIAFRGNDATSREVVEGYLLFRAAEITVEHGYDWFALAQRDTDKKSRTRVTSDPFQPWYGGHGYWRPSWRYYGGAYGWRSWDPYLGGPYWGDQVDVRTVERFEASGEIMMHKGVKPQGDPTAFDARSVIENLKPRIVYPTVK